MTRALPKARPGLMVSEQVRRGRRTLTLLDKSTLRVTVLEPWEHGVLVLCNGERSAAEIADLLRGTFEEVVVDSKLVEGCLDFLAREQVLENHRGEREARTSAPVKAPGPRTLADIQNAYREWHRDPEKTGRILTGLSPFVTEGNAPPAGLGPTVALPDEASTDDKTSRGAHAVGTVIVARSYAAPRPSAAPSAPSAPTAPSAPSAPTTASVSSVHSGRSVPSVPVGSPDSPVPRESPKSTDPPATPSRAAASQPRPITRTSIMEEIDAIFAELSGPNDTTGEAAAAPTDDEPTAPPPPPPPAQRPAATAKKDPVLGAKPTNGTKEVSPLFDENEATVVDSAQRAQGSRIGDKPWSDPIAHVVAPLRSLLPRGGGASSRLESSELRRALAHFKELHAHMPESASVLDLFRAIESAVRAESTPRAPSEHPTEATARIFPAVKATLIDAFAHQVCPHCFSSTSSGKTSCGACGFKLETGGPGGSSRE